MRLVLWFLAGIATAAVLAVIVAGALFKTTTHGFSTNAPPTPFETWASREARAMAVPGEVKRRENPVSNGSDVLEQARAHWADHCATCHGNDGRGQTEMGKHLYPPAPDMTKRETQQMTDGELFYIIQNGIRLSGMPAWGSEHSGEEDSWKLVRFIRHLPNATQSELQEMERLNPKSPHEIEEEQQEEQFLKGQPTDSTAPKHQHH